jgi:hypothetical protein
MFSDPDSHFVLYSFLEFGSLLGYDLFVVEDTLCVCFLGFEFFLIVTDDLKLFD